MVCAWAWRVVETRAYTATPIRHLPCPRPHRPGVVVLRGCPAHQQLVGLIPTTVAVAAGAELAADGPGRAHRALLPGRHRSGAQSGANTAAGPPGSSPAAPAARSRTCHL